MQNQVSRPSADKRATSKVALLAFSASVCGPSSSRFRSHGGDRLVSGVRFGAGWALGRSSRGTGTDDGRRGPER